MPEPPSGLGTRRWAGEQPERADAAAARVPDQPPPPPRPPVGLPPARFAPPSNGTAPASAPPGSSTAPRTRQAGDRQPPPPPAARLFHAAPLVRAAQPAIPVVPARPRFEANPGLRLAQLAVLTQIVIAVICAVELIRGSLTLAQLGSGVTLSTSATLAANYGIGIAVIAAVLLLGLLTVSLPSQIVRTLLAVLEILLLGLTLAAHFGGGSVLGFATVLAVGASGSAVIPFGGVVALQSAAIYLLAIHPPTYRAFASRGTGVR